VCPTVTHVSHIQETYFKCPTVESCFLLSEMCNPKMQSLSDSINCNGSIIVSNKLCKRIPHSGILDFEQPACQQPKTLNFGNHICDGKLDCLDRSDESMCPEHFDNVDFSIFNDCTQYNGQEQGFKCGKKCISSLFWCNKAELKSVIETYNLNHTSCPMLLKTLNNEKLCQNFTFWSNRTCPKKFFRSTGYNPGKCYPEKTHTEFLDQIRPYYYENNGIIRKCNNNKTIIFEADWCDGYVHCPDGSDEDPNDCGKCPRTYGFPKDRKYATFSCKHKYTGRLICAVPCDGKEDLCLDDVDEQCSSASITSTLLFGTALVILSVIAGELYIWYKNKHESFKTDRFQLTMMKKMSIVDMLQSCFEGCLNSKKIFIPFKKIHNSENFAYECVILSKTLGLINGEKAHGIAKLFYNLECKYHSGNIESVHICIRRNFETNENAKELFKLLRKPPTKRKSYHKLIPSAILKVLNTQFAASAYFYLLVSAKLLAYYVDMYKDIYVIIEFSEFITLSNLNFNSFGFQVYIMLIVSVTLPLIFNWFTLYHAKEWLHLKPKNINLALLIVWPLVPAVAIYVTSKQNFLTQRVKTLQHYNKGNLKNVPQLIKTLTKNDFLMQQSSTLLSDLRSNENATEHFVQSLVLILLIALKFTKSGTVSGFQELLTGDSNLFFLVLSAIWSIRSIISGYLQKKIVQNNHSMPFTGIVVQLSYATVAMICRISAIVIFFAPAMGLFSLLEHWKMGSFHISKDLIFDLADNGTLLNANNVWKQINTYNELTLFELDVYYIAFLLIFLFHFILAAAVKLKSSNQFKSREIYLKKILHILHQGYLFTFSAAQNFYNELLINLVDVYSKVEELEWDNTSLCMKYNPGLLKLAGSLVETGFQTGL
jgi:hypothetical protein